MHNDQIANLREWIGPHNSIVWTTPSCRVMIQRIHPGDLTPEEAREVAHLLIEAADHHIEQEQE